MEHSNKQGWGFGTMFILWIVIALGSCANSNNLNTNEGLKAQIAENEFAMNHPILSHYVLLSFFVFIIVAIVIEIYISIKQRPMLEKIKEIEQANIAIEKVKRTNYKEKYSIPNIPKNIFCIEADFLNSNRNVRNTKLLTWKNNENIFFTGIDYMNDIGKYEIRLENIISFVRQGDVYTETNVTGGGGGGSSLTGAVLGGVVAGGAGAVIGSRKKTESIKTETKRIDERKTILEYAYLREKHYMFFDSETYEVFLKLIPQKEINFSNRDNTVKFEKLNETNVTEKIRELAKLKDEGILTEEEFNSKKKELLLKF